MRQVVDKFVSEIVGYMVEVRIPFGVRCNTTPRDDPNRGTWEGIMRLRQLQSIGLVDDDPAATCANLNVDLNDRLQLLADFLLDFGRGEK